MSIACHLMDPVRNGFGPSCLRLLKSYLQERRARLGVSGPYPLSERMRVNTMPGDLRLREEECGGWKFAQAAEWSGLSEARLRVLAKQKEAGQKTLRRFALPSAGAGAS